MKECQSYSVKILRYFVLFSYLLLKQSQNSSSFGEKRKLKVCKKKSFKYRGLEVYEIAVRDNVSFFSEGGRVRGSHDQKGTWLMKFPVMKLYEIAMRLQTDAYNINI